jgi:hypothetical protein
MVIVLVCNQAYAINNAGQIVGYALHGGDKRAVLLNPVPEPSTFALLGMSMFGLLCYAWRRRKA